MTQSIPATHVAFWISSEQAPPIEELAWAHNCLCVTHEPPDQDAWPAEISSLPQKVPSCCRVTFEEEGAAQGFQHALKNFFHIESECVQENILPWLEYHKPYMQPMRIEGLTIIPQEPPELSQIPQKTLFLPAGLGFGTGRHPTTSGCLRLIQKFDLEGKVVGDFGCGSGILALAALILGAKKAWLHDHDPQALGAAERHLLSHGVSDHAQIIAQAQNLSSCDLLLANILFEPLCLLESKFFDLTHAGGYGIFSGLLTTQEADFLSCYSKWQLIDRYEEEQWCSLILQKPQ